MADNFPSEWFHCKYCGAGYLSKQDMVEHEEQCSVKRISTLSSRDFQKEWYFCPHCGVAYLSQEEVAEHEKHCTCREEEGEEEEEEGEETILLGEEVTDGFQSTCYGTADERHAWIRCPITKCGQIFEQDEMLLAHMEIAHFSQGEWQVINSYIMYFLYYVFL